MKILLLLSLAVLSSCYSPKTDVEEDKYPEIPEFPNFSDKKVVLEKVMELPLSQKDNCSYLVKDNYFFIYNYPKTDSHENHTNRIFIMREGKLTIAEQWSNIPNINNLAFIDDRGNLYANNRKYIAPDFRQKKILPFYDTDDITKKYEHFFDTGESEKDSALLKKIADEKSAFQQIILDKTDKILLVSDEARTGILNYADYRDNYLGNPDQEDPYFISSNVLKSLEKFSEQDDPLYITLHPKIKLSRKENIFSADIRKETRDTVFFKIKDKTVSGNQWFSTGNHFVASFGYQPVYMYYYDVKLGNKTISTKENHTKIITLDPIRTATGKYFLVSNVKEGKFEIYYLKN
jgi:hypothetical protein